MATAGGARGTGPERAWAASLPAAGEVVLDAEESAHLVRSRRVREGAAVVLFDGRGALRLGRLVRADPRAAAVAVEGDYPERAPARCVRLAVALPEMGRADRLVATLAELGVAALAPLAAERGAPGRSAQARRRAGRWAKLAREACKVNGCARALVVEEARDLGSVLAAGALLLDPDPAAPRLVDLVAGLQPLPWLAVGPEGGFTTAELATARAAGAAVARIGSAALRVETAAVAAAVVALA